MRVLVLTNLYPPDVIGGYELGCRQAVDALRARGHDVLVLTIAPRTPALAEPHVRRSFRLAEVWNSNRYVINRSHDVSNRLTEAEATGVSSYNVHVLTRAVEEFRPDVAYVWHLVGVGGLGLMATLQHLRLPWVWHLMDDVPVQLCRSRGRVVEPILAEVARQLDGSFLACSEQLVAEVEAGGIPLRGRVEIVPNWVVGPAPAPRAEFYRPGATLRIMAAGQVAQHKGVDLLIEAVARLRSRGREGLAVDIYGSVEDATFPALARRLGVDRLVRFRGPRPQAELQDLYSHHDVFAFPTWSREPFAFAPLEAARRGCVPLMSGRCGNAEWAVHGVHCLKAERTPEAFAEALLAVMDGIVDLGPLARRGAATVGRDFHLDRVAPRIERALVAAADTRRGEVHPGTAAEAYRMALLAEKLANVLIQEAAHA